MMTTNSIQEIVPSAVLLIVAVAYLLTDFDEQHPCIELATMVDVGDTYRCDTRVVDGEVRVLAIYEEGQ